jgi:hypothetical protein
VLAAIPAIMALMGILVLIREYQLWSEPR